MVQLNIVICNDISLVMDWVMWWLVTLALLSHCLGLQQQQKQNDKEYVSITIIFLNICPTQQTGNTHHNNQC